MAFERDRAGSASDLLGPPRGDRESFVVRVWLEEPTGWRQRAPWRGRIIHVPTSEELCVSDLNRFRDFIAEHLDRMGARLTLSRRLALWLGRLTRREGSAR